MGHLYERTGFEEESKITHNTTDTGAVNICKSERLCLHPFVFTDTSFLSKCINMYVSVLLQKADLEFSSKISQAKYHFLIFISGFLRLFICLFIFIHIIICLI